MGGAVGGFFVIVGVVAIIWFIRCIHVTYSWIKSRTYTFARKKYRKYNAVSLVEKDIVFSHPMTRGGDRFKQEVDNESHDGRLSAALIDVSDVGLTPTTSASGTLTNVYSAPRWVGEVGRHNSSVGTISSHQRLLQAINSPPSPVLPQLVSSSGAVLSSSSTQIAGHGPERRSPWLEKTHAWDAPSSSGAILPNDGQFQGLDDGPSSPGNVQPSYMV